MGLGFDQLGPSPSESNKPTQDGPVSSGHKGYETTFVGGETGLNQGLVLRLPMPSAGNVSSPSESNTAEEGNKELSREEGEIRKDLPQDDDCVQMERYVINYNDQSPSSRFSVFGRPLLLGDFSGLGGITGNEDMELMRKEAENDRARGQNARWSDYSRWRGGRDRRPKRGGDTTRVHRELEIRQLGKQLSG